MEQFRGHITPALRRQRWWWGYQKFKVILRYIVSLRLVWATRDPVLQHQNRAKETTLLIKCLSFKTRYLSLTSRSHVQWSHVQ